jgi:uncharacterized glyoxalase superfamily protein PhnB
MLRNPRYVIAVHDLERSANYYRDVLGFEVREIGARGWRVFVKDDCVIMAGECPGAISPEALGDHSYFAYIEVDELERFYDELVARNAKLMKGLRTEPWGMKEFGIRTIDGHRIMFGSFATGQEAKFALEFYPPHELRQVDRGQQSAEHTTGSKYRIRGQAVIARPEVWVIDTGRFMAFQEQKPPRSAVPGAWMDGDIYLGIDPFFYFERLHKLEGMPPLSYRWLVREIQLETTPWLEKKDTAGRTVMTRDVRHESFARVDKTDAWKEDHGRAHYVLGCEQLGAPESR